jgi:LPXTG-site transpeptidase (sortase) family protein
MLSKKKKILIVVGILIVLLLIMDFPYLSARIKFLFRGHNTGYQQPSQITSAPQQMEPNLLLIDSLGIKAPIVYVDQANETAFQAALINGVVHYPGTAVPGQFGNCYIFGHSSDYIWSKGKYKSIFAVLPSISKGAEIIISDSSGNKFIYTVADSRRVAANDTSVLAQDNTKKTLTLQTSYPVGTALARWVVVAEIK